MQDGAVFAKAKIRDKMSSSSTYKAVPDTLVAGQTATDDVNVASADSEDELVE